MQVHEQAPEPFKTFHRAILESANLGDSVARAEVEPGLHAIVVASGGLYPRTIALEFEAGQWPADKALEWLLTNPVHVVKFERAVE